MTQINPLKVGDRVVLRRGPTTENTKWAPPYYGRIMTVKEVCPPQPGMYKTCVITDVLLKNEFGIQSLIDAKVHFSHFRQVVSSILPGEHHENG